MTICACSSAFLLPAKEADPQLAMGPSGRGFAHEFFERPRALKVNLDDLSVSDGLVLLDSRCIVLPLSAIKPVLKLLHSSHSGITKTTALACGLYFWPGMTNDIKQLVSSCPACKVLPSQPANPMVTPSPLSHFGYPMQHIGLDLFSYANKDYLICVDHWSGYPFYHQLRSLLSLIHI